MRCRFPRRRPDGRGPFSDAERAAPRSRRRRRARRGSTPIDWRVAWLSRFSAIPGPDPPPRRASSRAGRRASSGSGLPADPRRSPTPLCWLRASRARAATRSTLVHGDYRLGNFLVERDGGGARLTGILDWEMVHLGDPLEDLAWCARRSGAAGTDFALGVAAARRVGRRADADATGRRRRPDAPRASTAC